MTSTLQGGRSKDRVLDYVLPDQMERIVDIEDESEGNA